MAASLSQQAGRSAIWQVAGGGWATLVRLGSSVFLARALSPADYGVFGMALIMRELVEHLGALGMGAGVIVRKDVTDEDICTCFWSMAAIRIVMFITAFFCAPLAGWFFNDPRVDDVVRVISVTFLFTIFGGLSQTLLFKELRFKELNIIRGLFVFVESSLAVILALNTDWGYWVLVISMLVNSFFSELAIFIRARWWPKFKFSRESFHYLFRFGINGLGFSITSYLRQNLDYLVVGRLLGTATLGLYEFAYRIPHLVLDRISRPVGAVVFPSLAKVQDNNEILVNGYIKSVKYICLVTFPMLFGLAAVADIAVPILWGEQWLPIVVPMQLLCVCAALRMIPQPLGAIFNCKNRPDLPFKISLIGLLWTVSVVGGLAYYYGLIGIAFGMVLAVLDGYVSLFIAFKMIDAKVKNLLLKILPVLICSLLSSISSYLFIVIFENKFNSSTLLIASISVGVLVYFYSIYVFFRPIYDEIIGNISSFKVG